MKKNIIILTLTMLTAGGMASAQNFELKSHGNTLTNGERVNITSYWDAENDCFDPEITLTTTTDKTINATAEFVKNDCSPALQLDEDGMDYQYGIGNAKLQMCGFENCEYAFVGQTIKQSGTIDTNTPHNMMIELGYTIGYDDPNLDNKTVNAEFIITVEQGGETISVTFYVDTTEAGVENITANNNVMAQYYNLHGQLIPNPGKGLYIKRIGDKVSKVIL